MKKIVFLVVIAMLSAGAAAAEELAANLTLSATIGSDCTPNMGKGSQPIIWKGVTDKRSTKVVGVLKKGDEETDVVSSEPLEKLIGDGLKTVFEKCGYTVSTGSDADGVQVSAVLNEFFGGSKKGLIIGETQAKGSLTLNLIKAGRSVELEFGASTENKGLKKKNIKKLEQTLSDVLAMMLNSVAQANRFAEAIKDLSK